MLNIMRILQSLLATFALSFVALSQAERGFNGLWKFNAAKSEMQGLPAPPDRFLRIEQSATTLTWSASLQESSEVTTKWSYSLDGKPQKRQVGDSTTNTVTKWEGAALLVNTIVSGPQNYTVMERWSRSRDGNTLTVKQTIVRISGETESVLVYDNAASVSVVQAREPEPRPIAPPTVADSPPPVSEYAVQPGTRILLRLTNALNTKYSSAGDRVYLETMVPIFTAGHLVIPRGSSVIGTVVDSHPAGRVKGKSAMNLRFDSLTLPNGVTRDFRSLPGSVDGRGNLERKEGKIEGESNKGGDARTVATTTGAGAGIGTIAGAASGHYGMGAGIGAAAGAAAGLAGVLTKRGADVVLPAGTTMELVLDRELRFSEAELRSLAQ